MLVDAGPDVAAVDRCLDDLGVDRLPLVLLSHLDADHVGGLAGAVAGRQVGVVATGALSPTDDRLPAARPAVVMLKAEGVDLVAGGDASAEPWDAAPHSAGCAEHPEVTVTASGAGCEQCATTRATSRTRRRTRREGREG